VPCFSLSLSFSLTAFRVQLNTDLLIAIVPSPGFEYRTESREFGTSSTNVDGVDL